MAKRTTPPARPVHQQLDMGRGQVTDNYVKALATSIVCRTRRVEDKTKYTRKAKHRAAREGFAVVA